MVTLAAFALCVAFGAAVRRYWASLVPFAVVAGWSIANLTSTTGAYDQNELIAGAIFAFMVGAVGAAGAILGVALRKAIRREPSAA